jgi:hypothetical protein
MTAAAASTTAGASTQFGIASEQTLTPPLLPPLPLSSDPSQKSVILSEVAHGIS